MQLNIDGKTYLDGLDLTVPDFYKQLRGMKSLPFTSSPAPTSFLNAFEAASVEADDILCLTVSSKLSSTHDSANAAAAEAKERLPNTRIEILDTETAAGAEGLIVTQALRSVMGGDSLDKVLAACRLVIAKISLLAFLDTLYYVWKSGRVLGVTHAVASVLKVKPLFDMARGEVTTVDRPRTAAKAKNSLLELMHQRIGSSRIHAAVMHADVREEAEALHNRVEAEFDVAELFITEFSPVMGAHTGPGLLGVAFWANGQ